MPWPSGTLSSFMRRDAQDHMMFGFVEGMRRGMKLGLPGVTEERIEEHVTVEIAVRSFATAFSLAPHEFNVESQCRRYLRIVKEFHEDQRTKVEAP